VAVPIGTGEAGVRGVVLLARETGRQPFSATETETLQAFAAQAAVAMELAERRLDAQEIAVLQDRDRIARDLHDLAIQRLFATGMTLQSTSRFIDHPEAAERVVRAVDDLDETIKIIRSTIFGLRSRGGTGGDGCGHVCARVGEAAPVLGFAPSVRMEGLVETRVPRETADHLVAVLSEALTNIARHAHADRADISLTADSHQVRLTVTDNGCRHSGERPPQRAAEHGGAGRTAGRGAGVGQSRRRRQHGGVAGAGTERPGREPTPQVPHWSWGAPSRS
jgi:signal transduction histidine kinase